MKVKELITKLRSAPPNLRVVFDVEAARFDVHEVDVDTCWYEPDIDAVVLGTKALRRHATEEE
jgi:hypothetical protein